jgi:antitoxin (DNA-binding transcriptional repressor) of toxin-antitoxin stability system
MRAVGLKTLKNRLSEYVRLAANGETVLVTDHDRVVAELAPPRAGRGEALADAMLAEAVRRGWVAPPTLVEAAAPPASRSCPSALSWRNCSAIERIDDLSRHLGCARPSPRRGSHAA